MKKTTMTLMIIAAFYTFDAHAGKCVMKINRKACAGKETEAYKPYNGKVETEETKEAKDEADCEKQAEKASKIVRKGTLSNKTVTATFDGKALAKPFEGKSECK